MSDQYDDLYSAADAFAMAFDTFGDHPLPLDGSGSGFVKHEDTGATIRYGNGRISIQVTREGGDYIHSWTLAIYPRTPELPVRAWFHGSYPTDTDIERLRSASEVLNLNLSDALHCCDPKSIFTPEHQEQINQLAEAVYYKPPPRAILPVKRGLNHPTRHRLPGGQS